MHNFSPKRIGVPFFARLSRWIGSAINHEPVIFQAFGGLPFLVPLWVPLSAQRAAWISIIDENSRNIFVCETLAKKKGAFAKVNTIIPLNIFFH